MKRSIIVAIDGPAGSGKSTIAKLIAKKLSLLYIDTGAMYRALTLGVINKGINHNDIHSIINLAQKCHIMLKTTSGGRLKVTFNNIDVTDCIRAKEVSSYVSDISKIKKVREIMVSRQRALARCGNVVLEGRDIGTVVFPKADFKFFLDAGVNERTKRRYKEMKEKHAKVSYKEIRQNVKKRDKIDSARTVAPLKKAADAVYIDTTTLTIEEVVNAILKRIRTNSNIKN